MNNYVKVIALLEDKVILLLNKLKENHLSIEHLTEFKDTLKFNEEKLKIKITDLENQNNSLRIANNLLGSEEDKTVAKRKINKLIKEVDSCIFKLSETKNEKTL